MMTDEILFLKNSEYVTTIIRAIETSRTRVWASVFIIDSRFRTDIYYHVRAILAALRDAQRRGVDVRVLVGESDTFEIRAANLAAVRLLGLFKIPARFIAGPKSSHVKYVVIDDEYAALGSHNWAALAFSHSIDESVLVRSLGVANGLSERFAAAWIEARPPDQKAPGDFELPDDLQRLPIAIPPANGVKLSKGRCTLLLDEFYLPALKDLIRTATESINVTMFLYSASKAASGPDSLTQLLVASVRKGIAVKVLLDRDRKGEAYKTRVINRPTGRLLAQEGVEVRYGRPDRLLHAKVVVIDGRVVIIGSHNWTRPSLTEYHEASVLIRSSRAGRIANARFAAVWAGGREL
jgi:phosphatidylserine/phosphatidylglycerophosphate/cardiolipin synthase-like enzyme